MNPLVSEICVSESPNFGITDLRKTECLTLYLLGYHQAVVLSPQQLIYYMRAY